MSYLCEGCGSTWTRERKRGAAPVRCPNGCALEHRREVHTCEACEETFTRAPARGLAPRACPDCRGPRRADGRPGAAYHRAVCRVCSASYVTSSSRVVGGCSTECIAILAIGLGAFPLRSDFERATAPAASPPRYVTSCAVCTSPMTGRAYPHAVPRYCGGRCEWLASEARRGAPGRRWTAGPCVACGELFVGPGWGNGGRFCGDYCQKRDHRDRRRAKVRDAYVAPVTWRMLYRVDPTCYLCHELTDPDDFRRVEGSDGRTATVVGPRFPTVDHVLALANGGEHSPANARLACLACNSRKGAA
ncbi:HNH endonuclease [Microbacterium phage Honk]|uniref:HNH endonuclease n=1 Tax=Microbacterium phage Honk TaxID=2836095 RepID=A0A8F3E8B4_9CAUD|nr:HNH endonuclease [Microbacterium phage Honk]